MTAYLQKICDTPFIMELVEAPEGDGRGLEKGFINTDEIKFIWVLNQSIISEIVSQASTDATRKALKCTPIAPSIFFANEVLKQLHGSDQLLKR
jgi:hypothetical protein